MGEPSSASGATADPSGGAEQPCDACGVTAARVSVLSGYFAGQPVISRLCLICADDPRTNLSPARKARRRGRLGLLLVFIGAVLGVLFGFSDFIPGFDGKHLGIGYVQQAGIAAAVAAIFFGALLRIDLMAMAGSVLLVLSLSADLIVLNRATGFGWKQGISIGAASLLVLAGIAVRVGHIARERMRVSSDVAAPGV